MGGDRDDATVLEIVRERAEIVTEFILDPTRARRSDRVGDVACSQSAAPWGDLESARAWRASEVEPEDAKGARHGSRSRRAAVPLVMLGRGSFDGVAAAPAPAPGRRAPRFGLECPAGRCTSSRATFCVRRSVDCEIASGGEWWRWSTGFG